MRLTSASLEATPRHKGQTAPPLNRLPYGGIKSRPLLHGAQDRRCQTAIPHDGCDWNPIRRLRSLLRHPGRCGGTVEPATRDKTRSAQSPLLFCQLQLTGLKLILRMAPGPPSAGEEVRCRHEPLEEGRPSPQPEPQTPLEGSGTSTCLPDLLMYTPVLRPRGPGPLRAPPPLEHARL